MDTLYILFGNSNIVLTHLCIFIKKFDTANELKRNDVAFELY